jgi:glutamine synthetase
MLVYQPQGMLTVGELRSLVDTAQVDTVLVAMTDMQGRLQGKRCAARYFLEEVLTHATEACNYLLAVDVDMNTVSGYAMSSWSSGYGDFVLQPDLSTLRILPWHPATALVLCDVIWEDGSPVVASPRQVLRKQLDRLAERGLEAHVGTELEFIVFRDSFEEAWTKRYTGLVPANQYNVDYSMVGTARVEHLLRRIRNGMTGAGLYVESAKGECNLGQHEIAFRFTDALGTCDNHSIYKTGAKEIATQEDMSLSFMAKYDEREGNSCHIHISLRSTDGDAVLAGAHGGVHLLPRPERQLLQAIRARQLRPDVRGMGTRQPHLRTSRGGSRRLAAGGEPGPGRRRQSLPLRSGTGGGRTSRHRERAAAGAHVRRQRLRLGQAEGAHHIARRGAPARGEQGG